MLDKKKPVLVKEDKKDKIEVKQIKTLILKMTNADAERRVDVSEVISRLQPLCPGLY